MDPLVQALTRLIGDSTERRYEVADKIGVNEQTLYQITRSVKLKSGKPRSVGSKLRHLLDEHYPNWLADVDALPTAAGARAPALREALQVFLAALAGVPEVRRDELSQVLALLARTGALLYQQRLAELLAPPTSTHAIAPAPMADQGEPTIHAGNVAGLDLPVSKPYRRAIMPKSDRRKASEASVHKPAKKQQ